MLLGCIGDDFTGSSDLGNTLAKRGMRTIQYIGIPDGPAAPFVEAGIVALKTRSIPARDAVAQSLQALDWLRAQGCRQFLFKYCSTFDSTRDGNIGPVAEALAAALGADRVIFCPAFPGAGRSIYQGHLFVGDRLLSESGMENHPLTPMTDPDIRRWLAHQVGGRVGHVPIGTVRAGPEAIVASLDAEAAEGRGLVVVDALTDEDLERIGTAAADLLLVTGGSGIALGLPANFAACGLLAPDPVEWQGNEGRCVVLSGSCSAATRGQVALHARDNPALEIDAVAVIEGRMDAAQVAAFLLDAPDVPLAYSSADPDAVRAVQDRFGSGPAAAAVEDLFRDVSALLVAAGTRAIISAGGETSGAVVLGTQARELEIGPEIDPGVPALRAGPDLVLALKSGNFGAPDFFARAARLLTEVP